MQNNGHKEDILSVASCPPNLLATSSYDGEVIVWNMVSGHIFCHLRAPCPEGYKDQSRELVRTHLACSYGFSNFEVAMSDNTPGTVAGSVGRGPRVWEIRSLVHG